MTGVVETLRFLYQLDVADHATKPLLAAHRAEQKATTQTNALLARQDAARRRSGSTAASTGAQVTRVSTRNAQALDRETVAVRRNTVAQERANAARRRASDPSIVRRTAGNVGGTVKGAIGGVAAIASIASAKQAVSVTTDLTKTTIGLNKNLGLGVVQASRWAAVARARNIESKALLQTFGILGKNIDGATRGSKAQVAAFKTLGVTQKQLKDQNFDQTLKSVADGLDALPAGTERNTAAMKLFGRGWQTVVPILRGGSMAMDEQLKLADKYGVTLNGKTVKSVGELIAAQREAKFATMGLQIAFATQVVPTLTKVINKTSEFAAQMRSGEGAGGRFAKQAREVADDLRPVATALKSVGGFLVEHPRLVVAAAGAYVAFKSARGTMRIVNDLRDMKTAVIAARNAAAKSRIAMLVADGAAGATGRVRRALSGMRDTITAVMRRAGRSGGAAAAESIASSAGSNMGPALDRNQKRFVGGRWSKIGRAAGRSLAAGVTVGAVIGLAGIGAEVSKKVKEELSKRGLWNPPGGKGSFWDDLVPTKLLPEIKPGEGIIGKIFKPKRGGGIVARRFQHGGLVPIAAAGGELLVDRGRAAMIPGAPDRDGTLLWARPGSAVLTGDGQARMAAGASLHEAIAAQAPHFATGGVVPGKYLATSYGPPWGGIQGTGVTRTGVNLKRNPHLYGIATDPRMIALGSKVFAYPNPFGYTGRFSAFDTGGAIKGRRVDFYDWRGRARQNAWGRRPVTISRARIAPRSDGEDTYRAPGGSGAETTISVLGRDRRRAGLLGDAFAQGRAAGQGGLTLSQIKREGNPVTRAIIEAMRGAGTQPDKGDSASKAEIAAADTGGFLSGKRLARMYSKASAIDAKRYQYSWGGGHGRIGVPTVGTRTSRGGQRGLGYDCSGAVSAVLGAGGLLKSPLTSGALMSWGRKGSSQNLAVYADPRHTIMRIGRRYFGTGEANPGGGAGWLPSNTMKGRGAVRTAGSDAASATGRRGPQGLPYRRGGIVGYARGGTVAGSRLTGGLGRVMTFAGGSFDALDSIIARAAELRLLALRRQVSRRAQRGGSKIVITRLQGVIDLIDSELGRRVGRIEDVVDRRTAKLERGRGATERMLRARGISADSTQGLAASQVQQAAEIGVRKQNVTSLQKALRTATRARNQEAIRDLTGKLHDAQDELAESLVRQVELARDQIRSKGEEAVNAAQFHLGLTQTGAAGIEAAQRLNRTQDTPEGMRQRAAALQGGVVPAMQAALQAHQLNAQLLASIGDVAGWRSAVQDAATAAVDLANAQADAADLMREAAARAAQDAVDAASHGRTIGDLGLQRLELEQQLVGTYDSGGGRQGRADFIRQQIIPAIQAELDALAAQQAAAQEAGDPVLARQIAEAIAGRKNEQLQAQLNALEAIKENTDPLKEFSGSSAFSFRDQVYRDNDVDVIAARLGA